MEQPPAANGDSDENSNRSEPGSYVVSLASSLEMDLRISESGDVTFGIKELFDEDTSSNSSESGGGSGGLGSGGIHSNELMVPAKRAWNEGPFGGERKKSLLGPEGVNSPLSAGEFYQGDLPGFGERKKSLLGPEGVNSPLSGDFYQGDLPGFGDGFTNADEGVDDFFYSELFGEVVPGAHLGPPVVPGAHLGPPVVPGAHLGPPVNDLFDLDLLFGEGDPGTHVGPPVDDSFDLNLLFGEGDPGDHVGPPVDDLFDLDLLFGEGDPGAHVVPPAGPGAHVAPNVVESVSSFEMFKE